MRDWHHAPAHRLIKIGAYIVTSGTYQKQHYFQSPERLSILHDHLLSLAEDYGWMMQAWAVFSNHYHFIGIPSADPSNLRNMVHQLHWETAILINDLDATPGRRIWYNYWDKCLTFEKSFLVRLNYVHYNPQKHGLCEAAENYPWCSAKWFEREAKPSFFRTVRSFRIDRLTDPDPY